MADPRRAYNFGRFGLCLLCYHFTGLDGRCA